MRRAAALNLFRAWETALFLLGLYLGLRVAGGSVASWQMTDLSVVLGAAALWSWLLQALGLYVSRRLASPLEEVGLVVAATTGTAGALAVIGALTGLPFARGEFVVTFWAGLTAAVIGGRLAVRLALWQLRRRGRNLRFVVIVGGGRRGRDLADRIEREPGLGYRLRGIVDDTAMLATLPARFEPLGDLDALGAVAAREPIDEVLIALPIRSGYDRIVATLRLCERLGVPARVFSDLFELDTLKTRVERIGSAISLKVYNGPTPGLAFGFKRALDLVVAGAGLVLFAPLFAVIAVAITLDSPGPVFFVQRRVGLNKRSFPLLKFRTMAVDAAARLAELEHLNEASGPVFKMRDDPRVTRVGRFLRAHSLDELPQLLNILCGHMSVVGPRPLPLRDVARFEHDWHARRFSVRPGLTCSWVLSGRSDLAFDTWVRLDLDYIDNWSLKNDLFILCRTIPVVLTRTGAY